MSELQVAWGAVLLLSAALPVAVKCGIEIGRLRERDAQAKEES